MIELMLAKEPESRGHLAMPGNKLDPAAGKKNSVSISVLVQCRSGNRHFVELAVLKLDPAAGKKNSVSTSVSGPM